jgi:chromosomal replication initiator protein
MEDFMDIWQEILSELSEEIKKEELDIWFNSVEKAELDLDNNKFTIYIPNSFYIQWISKKEEKIKSKLRAITAKDIDIKYETYQATPTQILQNTSKFKEQDETVNRFNTNLSSEYTFDDMVVADFNKFAVTLSKQVTNEIGKNNPLFIYSKPGLGKTHILHAIGNELINKKSSVKVLYATAEYFVNEYIDSIKQNKVDVFRNKYRNLDCLLIDDIQFIVEKGRSEEEFFFTFNTLFEGRKQIVITSDRSPNDINLNERLISRFKSGLVADIKPPAYEERMAILKREVEKNGYNIQEEILTFVAQNVKDSIRSLKGCIMVIHHHSVYSGEYPTLDRVKEWIKDYIPIGSIENEMSNISIENIQAAVAEEYGVSIDDLKSKQRTERLAFPRQIAIYLACELLPSMSLPEIGKAFNKDHSTVIHARDKIRQILNTDPFFSEKINVLINKIKKQNVN